MPAPKIDPVSMLRLPPLKFVLESHCQSRVFLGDDGDPQNPRLTGGRDVVGWPRKLVMHPPPHIIGRFRFVHSRNRLFLLQYFHSDATPIRPAGRQSSAESSLPRAVLAFDAPPREAVSQDRRSSFSGPSSIRRMSPAGSRQLRSAFLRCDARTSRRTGRAVVTTDTAGSSFTASSEESPAP